MTRLRTANLLAALATDISERVEEQLKTHPNQTDTAVAALNVMSFWEGITNSELSRALKLSHTATVRLVDKLELQGLVEARSGRDLRATHLYLTAAGMKAVQPALTARCVAVEEYLSSLTSAEEKQLATLLEKIIRPRAIDDVAIVHLCRLCDFTSCRPDKCPMHAGHE